MGERGNIAPLPDPSETTPNIFIKASADAQPVGAAEIANRSRSRSRTVRVRRHGPSSSVRGRGNLRREAHVWRGTLKYSVPAFWDRGSACGSVLTRGGRHMSQQLFSSMERVAQGAKRACSPAKTPTTSTSAPPTAACSNTREAIRFATATAPSAPLLLVQRVGGVQPLRRSGVRARVSHRGHAQRRADRAGQRQRPHCIGCGYCHLSCPYSAPRVDRVKGHSVKCDGCIERVAVGESRCASRPARSRAGLRAGRRYGEARRARGHRAVSRPEATVPNLFVKPSADAVCGIEGRRRGEPVGSWIWQPIRRSWNERRSNRAAVRGCARGHRVRRRDAGPFYLQDPVKGDAGPAFAAMAAIDVAQAAVEWPFVDEAEARCDLDLMRSGWRKASTRRPGVGIPPPVHRSRAEARAALGLGVHGSRMRRVRCDHVGAARVDALSRHRASDGRQDARGSCGPHAGAHGLDRAQPAQDLGEFLRLHLLTWSSHFLDQLIEAAGQPFYEGLARLTKLRSKAFRPSWAGRRLPEVLPLG